MPYRRLPNTDQARLRALRTVVMKSDSQEYGQNIVSFKSLHEAKSYLNVFEKQLSLYQQTLQRQVEANKKFQQIVYNARMYVSHFIQVFNLAVIRGEIKKEHKVFYKLDPTMHNVPDLSSENALLQWGQDIINGETERISHGGMPLYNPTIAKVKVHYEIFKDASSTQKLHQSTTTKNWEELVKLREKGDQIILDIWNQIEAFYKDESPYIRLNKCKDFGIVYYYRKGEPVISPEI